MPRTAAGPGASARARLQARLRRVDAALCQWDAWAAARYLPPGARPPLRLPTRSLRALTALRARLLAELARLDPEADA